MSHVQAVQSLTDDYGHTCTAPSQFVILKVVNERMSYEAVSEQIKSHYGCIRGMSVRSVRRFCVEHGICRTSHMERQTRQNSEDRLSS